MILQRQTGPGIPVHPGRHDFQSSAVYLWPTQEMCLSAYASSFCLGAVLTWLQPSREWKTTDYIFRSPSETEQHYATIEKVALVVKWVCKWFRDNLTGLNFHTEIRYKPLVPHLTSKNLDQLAVWVQHFHPRLMRFNSYMQGKELAQVDTLCRAQVATSSAHDSQFQDT